MAGFADGYAIGARMKLARQQFEFEKQQAGAKQKLVDMELQKAQLAMQELQRQQAENARIADIIQGGGMAPQGQPAMGAPAGAAMPAPGLSDQAVQAQALEDEEMSEADGPVQTPQQGVAPQSAQPQGMEQIHRMMAGAALRQGKFAEAQKILEPYTKTPETRKPESPMGKLMADREAMIAQAKTPEAKVQVAQLFDAALEQEGQPKDMASRTFQAIVKGGADPLQAYATMKSLDRAPNEAEIALNAAKGDPIAQQAFKLLTTKSRAGATQISTGTGGEQIQFGKIDAGFQREIQRDSQGRIINVKEVPVPGSAAEQEYMAKEAKTKRGEEQKEKTGSRMIQDINRSLTLLEKGAASLPGMFGIRSKAGKVFKESKGGQLGTAIDSLKAGVSVSELNAMRQASPTGGALGNVTEGEHALMAQQQGSLDVDQPPEVLSQNLRRAHNTFMDMTHGKPEQIEAVAKAKGLDATAVKDLKFRYSLPFDEFGRPVEVQQPTPKAPRAQTKTAPPAAAAPQMDPAALTPADLQEMTPAQLKQLRDQLKKGQ